MHCQVVYSKFSNYLTRIKRSGWARANAMSKLHSQSHQNMLKTESDVIDRLTKVASTSMALSRRGFIKSALASTGALGLYLLGFNPPPAYAHNGCNRCESGCTRCQTHVHCCSLGNVWCVDFDCYCRFGSCLCIGKFKGMVWICDDGHFVDCCWPQCILC